MSLVLSVLIVLVSLVSLVVGHASVALSVCFALGVGIIATETGRMRERALRDDRRAAAELIDAAMRLIREDKPADSPRKSDAKD